MMMSRHEEFVRSFSEGDLIAYATLQSGLSHFDTSYGRWSYRRVGGIDVTLGGPLCAPRDRLDMARLFLAQSRKPLLCYLRSDFMNCVTASGLHATGIGVDRVVDIERLRQSPAPEIASAQKKAKKVGLTLQPLDVHRITPTMREELTAIQADYLTRAQCTVEMSFINRPMDFANDGMRRFFTLQTHEGLLGFGALNPVFRRGVVTHYLLDILRFRKTKLWGVWLACVSLLAAQLHEEGVGLSLGFAPLHHIATCPNHSRVALMQMKSLARWLGHAQYVQRLRELKALVPGTEEPRFLASHTRIALVNALAIIEASGVEARRFLGPDLIRTLIRSVRAQVRTHAA
jgi:lysylphosphatidylglycerol synthetase-like protein (DUF2156 family)